MAERKEPMLWQNIVIYFPSLSNWQCLNSKHTLPSFQFQSIGYTASLLFILSFNFGTKAEHSSSCCAVALQSFMKAQLARHSASLAQWNWAITGRWTPVLKKIDLILGIQDIWQSRSSKTLRRTELHYVSFQYNFSVFNSVTSIQWRKKLWYIIKL